MKPAIIVLALSACAAVADWVYRPGAHASETPAGDAEWAKRLIPEAAGPGALSPISAEPVNGGVELICGLTYPDIKGEPVDGQVKLYIPATLRDNADAKLPLIHFAGYEIERAGGERHLQHGVVLSTSHGELPNPLVRGENLDVAILHRLRALPFIDDSKVQIIGGSAGGYMTLMLAAETFPLSCAGPDVPPFNLGYNVAYFAHNKALAPAQPEGQDHPNMPVLAAVIEIGELTAEVYGEDCEGDAWLAASPINRLDEITCPTLITYSTADILVPIHQVGPEFAAPVDPAKFPEGFEIRVDAVVARPATRQTLMDVLPPERLEVFKLTVPDTAPRMRWDGTPSPGEAPVLEMPFSREKTFTLVVLDEGPVEPQCAHTKYFVDANKDAFLQHTREAAIAPAQLTGAKLQRLMLRYQHIEAHPALVQPPGSPAPFVANRLDFPELERADVLRGLRAFAADPECAKRLVELYEALPDSLKALGEDLTEGGPDAILDPR